MVDLIWAVVVSWIAWLTYRIFIRALEQRERRRALIERVVDRLPSTDEWIAFVRSAEGRELLHGPTSAWTAANPRRSVIRFVQSGILILCVGIALLVSAMRYAGATDMNFINEATNLRYWGTAGVALGVGLLIVAFVSNVLAIRWGLLERRERG